jgi:peptide/nickel transport system permease protein
MAGAENLEAAQAAQKDTSAKVPFVDLSDIDPLAPKYAEWAKRTAEIKITDTPRADTLLFGGDKWGRDVIQKAIKGAETSIFVWADCGPAGHHHRYGPRCHLRLHGRQDR